MRRANSIPSIVSTCRLLELRLKFGFYFSVSINVIIYPIPSFARQRKINYIDFCGQCGAIVSENLFVRSSAQNKWLWPRQQCLFTSTGCIMRTIKIYVHKYKMAKTRNSAHSSVPHSAIYNRYNGTAILFYRKSFSETHSCGAKSFASIFYYKWNSWHFWQMPNRLRCR